MTLELDAFIGEWMQVTADTFRLLFYATFHLHSMLE